tara:strand:- start:98 stop:340 length:243 start_codon:yes stop_codon:yes gene_type:complete
MEDLIQDRLLPPLREILKDYFDQCDMLKVDPIDGAMLVNKEMMRYVLDEYNIEWYVYCGALQLLCSEPEVRTLISKRKIN